MGLRDWINQNSSVATIAAVVLLVVALVWLTMQSTGSRGIGPGDAYYYDTETGEVFVASGQRIPPIQSPDGNDAVRAHFFACGECTEESRFLGYYEKYTEQAKKVKKTPVEQRVAQESGEGPPAWQKTLKEGHVLSVDGEEWQSARPNDPSPIMQQLAQEHCGGDRRQLRRCQP